MEIPEYEMKEVSYSPSCINEPCGWKKVFGRLLKQKPSVNTNYTDRDAGTFCHEIFELFHKDPELKRVLGEISTLSEEEYMFKREGILEAFIEVIGPIIQRVIGEMSVLRPQGLTFDVSAQEIKIENFLRQEIRRLTELIKSVGPERAALDYFLPVHSETKFRTSGRLYHDEEGNRISEFDPDDPFKFSCVVDFVRVVPGSIFGYNDNSDIYVLGDYKTGKNRAGYDLKGNLIYEDGSPYAHKAVLQCVYPIIYAANLNPDQPLRQILKCTHYEIFNPTPGPPDFASGPRKGTPKTLENWRPGLKKKHPEGTRVGPYPITKALKIEARTEILEERRKWKQRDLKPTMKHWSCSQWCTDYYEFCHPYWEAYKNAEGRKTAGNSINRKRGSRKVNRTPKFRRRVS
jgi:hypothetical protein